LIPLEANRREQENANASGDQLQSTLEIQSGRKRNSCLACFACILIGLRVLLPGRGTAGDGDSASSSVAEFLGRTWFLFFLEGRLGYEGNPNYVENLGFA